MLKKVKDVDQILLLIGLIIYFIHKSTLCEIILLVLLITGWSISIVGVYNDYKKHKSINAIWKIYKIDFFCVAIPLALFLAIRIFL